MCLKLIKYLLVMTGMVFLLVTNIAAQEKSYYLTVEQLFEKGSRQHLQLVADRLNERVARERVLAARATRYPEIEVGVKGGILGQPIVWKHGLSDPTWPETPDWQQNYSLDVTQLVYQGGKIKYTLRQANIEQEIAEQQTIADQADIKLTLLEEYLNLFTLYKQSHVLTRNIEESERRLKDIRRLEAEGIITNNDVLRSEMQLTEDRLAVQQTWNNIRILSRKLDILLGLDECLLLVPDSTLLERFFPVEEFTDYVPRAYRLDPSMQLLRKKTELAENRLRLTRSDSRPRLSFYASNTLARPVSRTMADMYNISWNVGFSFTYSLSSLYRNKHRVNEAAQDIFLSRNEEDQKRQAIRLGIQTALLRHHEAVNRVEAMKLSMKQAEENYRIMNNRYLNQLAILTDLLDADNLRLNAELQLTAARVRVVYTYYELQRAVGEL